MDKNQQKIYDHIKMYGPLNIATVAYDLEMVDIYVWHVMTDMFYSGLIVGDNVDGYTININLAEKP